MPQIPIDFVLFALTLAGVALFDHHTLRVAVSGLAVIAGGSGSVVGDTTTTMM